MDPHLRSDPERRALAHVNKQQADEAGLVTRKGIAHYFRTTIGTVGNWSHFPTFPRPIALLTTSTHPALLYRSGPVVRWVRKFRPQRLKKSS